MAEQADANGVRTTRELLRDVVARRQIIEAVDRCSPPEQIATRERGLTTETVVPVGWSDGIVTR